MVWIQKASALECNPRYWNIVYNHNLQNYTIYSEFESGGRRLRNAFITIDMDSAYYTIVLIKNTECGREV